VAYVVADYDTSGALRGYCRYDADRVAAEPREADDDVLGVVLVHLEEQTPGKGRTDP